VAALIVVVIGAIYAGYATPTEAAAIGVLGALLLSLVFGSLSWASFADSVLGATRTSCMIAFILAGAAFLSVSMGFLGIPRMIAQGIAAWDLSPNTLLVVLTLFYIGLGCFLDGISIVVLTTSVIQPMILAAGINPVWYGIFVVLVVELAQITPPVGFNLFVLQGLTGRDIFYIARAALPFFAVLILGIALLMAFPEIATYLPQRMMAR
jgi:C4-dicarboxylate transporter, DctM subunit